ncbi:MAG: YabP/YqfC family sporulation protein [Clostridiales bacterium]|nr:YabP/YqfC family sporulation protein [Clostridiales bacterium]
MKRKSTPYQTDFPLEYYNGTGHIEIIGNRECVVDGLKSILEYSSEKIKLNIGRRTVTFLGSALHIGSFTGDGAVIEGEIMTMEFSDAG